MAEDFGFDPTKKKKKKKKVESLDDEAGEAEVKAEAPQEEAAPAVAVEAAPAKAAAVDLNDDMADLLTKKKKKKKKLVESLDDEVPEGGEPAETSAPAAAPADQGAAEPADDDVAFGDVDMALPDKKKKKKKKAVSTFDDDLEDVDVPQTVPTGGASNEAEHEFTYGELLERIFSIMRQKNPDIVAGEKRQMVIKPPQVHRLGTRRTAFANFVEYAQKMLRRPPEHLQNFLVAELGASGSVDGSAALVIRGRFQQKQIENVLRRYIREYVTCHTCKSSETQLEKEKESRLSFLKCETCGSRCSVASIRAGFQAVTGKRAAMRAKEG